MRFTYDMSGLLEAEATVVSTKVKRSIVISSNSEQMSEEDIKQRLKALAALKQHPRDDAQNVALIARLKRCYEMKLGDERQFVSHLLGQFEGCVERQDKHEIEGLRAEISEKLDQLEGSGVF